MPGDNNTVPLLVTVNNAANGQVIFPPKALTPTDFRGTEGLSQLFSYELLLSAPNSLPISFEQVLGQVITITLFREDNQKRFFRGLCNTFTEGLRDNNSTLYRATIVPLFWLLTRRVRSRIFEHKTVPAILEEVLSEVPGLDFVLQLAGTYPPHDYCTQYRESDFNFACRLMEEEGIYYFFDHFEGSTLMVLADAPGNAHTDIQTKVLFGPGRSISFLVEPNRIFEWEKGQQLRSGKYTLRDHHFELNSPGITESPQSTRPLAVKAGTVSHPLNLLGANHDIIDYPGDAAHRFDDVDLSGGISPKGVAEIKKDNDRTARIRIQQETVSGLLIVGTSSCAAFAAGQTFGVTDHFNANGQYLLVSVTHAASQAGVFSGNGSGGFTYQNGFTCIPFTPDFPFRPPRVASRPFIPGTQTATVVGLDKDGEKNQDIFTDKFGRVKVQFHWDREHQHDPKSSCWVRVGTLWAGRGWGVIHIPRVGQEVIVAFLEGNPDQPIIVGSVYNAQHMPPWELPKHRTRSGIKTRSSPKGEPEHFNELHFEDMKGCEDIFFHAERNFHREVECDDDLKVFHDQCIMVHKNRTETVKEGDENVTIEKGDRTVTLDKGDDTHLLKKGDRAVQIDMGNDTLTIKMGDQTTKLDLGKSATEAMQSIELKVGQSSIKLDQTGVTIKGMMISVEGQITTDVKAPLTTVKGDGMLTLKGGVTMIG